MADTNNTQSDINNKLFTALRSLSDDKALWLEKIMLKCSSMDTEDEQLTYLESVEEEIYR